MLTDGQVVKHLIQPTRQKSGPDESMPQLPLFDLDYSRVVTVRIPFGSRCREAATTQQQFPEVLGSIAPMGQLQGVAMLWAGHSTAGQAVVGTERFGQKMFRSSQQIVNFWRSFENFTLFMSGSSLLTLW